MKFLKIAVIVTTILSTLTSCTKEELKEDDVLTTYTTSGGKDVR